MEGPVFLKELLRSKLRRGRGEGREGGRGGGGRGGWGGRWGGAVPRLSSGAAPTHSQISPMFGVMASSVSLIFSTSHHVFHRFPGTWFLLNLRNNVPRKINHFLSWFQSGLYILIICKHPSLLHTTWHIKSGFPSYMDFHGNPLFFNILRMF